MLLLFSNATSYQAHIKAHEIHRGMGKKIVRVQYFVRGGFVGHRSRASSKHLSPHLPVDGLASSEVKKGLRCSSKMHVWVSGPQRSRPDVDVLEKRPTRPPNGRRAPRPMERVPLPSQIAFLPCTSHPKDSSKARLPIGRETLGHWSSESL
ncbi:hypothetical protein TNCV_1346521 [Trichonephila clavipes]|nr:hypothetical protein TNCV_1346521 [Trichonephila clavipes]